MGRLAAAMLLMVLIAGSVWLLFAGGGGGKVRHLAVVADVSTSAAFDTLCADVGELVEAERPEGGTRYSIRLFTTGEAATGQEPTRHGPWSAEPSRLLLHRAPAGGSEDDPLYREARAACAGWTATKETPLFRAVRMALAELAGELAADPSAEAVLAVRSDLVEEEDAALRSRWGGARTASAEPLPRLDNRQVDVHFCGVTQRRVKPKSRLPSVEVLEAAWRAEFTAPERLRFRAGCP